MPIVITQQASRTWNGSALARLNQKTDALLKQVEENPGVSGAFVCDNHGALLAARFSRAPERRAVEEAGRSLAQILAAIESCGSKVKDVELAYDGWGVLLWDLGNAFEVVECAPTVNRALLRMALNVSAAEFEKDTELQKGLARIAPSRADTLEEQEPDAQRRIRRMQMGLASQMPPAAPVTIANAVDLMARFTNLLIEEYGDRGFGRDNVLRTAEHRLAALSVKHPLLAAVRIVDRQVDLSALGLAPADLDAFAIGWGALIDAIRVAAADNLGAKTANAKYAKAYQTMLERDGGVLKGANLERVLPKV